MQTQVGTIVDGKYEILKEIGRGGMSTVYLAMNQRLNQQWAIKEIRKTESGANDELIINSLLVEANLMKRLDHPALPRIVDIIDNGETLYVVMDYIEGRSLDKYLLEYGPQPQEQVLEWAKQLCDALSYLHSQKPPIIYRDMKPANVMLKPEGNVKLIDFGIAREYKETSMQDTKPLGTPGYAAPESRGRQTDARSDIYTLGMTMHHLLTGQDPRANGYMYHSICQWNPELSSGIERIIDKCTALEPDDRYQNCNELMYALQHYEEEEDVYKAKQRKSLRRFMLAAGMSCFLLIVGFAGLGMKTFTNNRDYEQMINISSSTPYETKLETYLNAIDLYGTDTRAYSKLLSAYQENGTFGDSESNAYMAKYNKNKDEFDHSEEYIRLLYDTGVTYLYLYSGGDNSFRTRVLKALPYFQEIQTLKATEFEYYNMVESYCILGEFYTQYVVNATSIKEPNKSAYQELLKSLTVCIDNMDAYDYDDAAYIKLTMYREIMNLLNEHRKGFAATGVNKNTVIEVWDMIRTNTQALSVTQQTSLDIKEDILDSYSRYVKGLNRSYTNTAERSE